MFEEFDAYDAAKKELDLSYTEHKEFTSKYEKMFKVVPEVSKETLTAVKNLLPAKLQPLTGLIPWVLGGGLGAAISSGDFSGILSALGLQ